MRGDRLSSLRGGRGSAIDPDAQGSLSTSSHFRVPPIDLCSRELRSRGRADLDIESSDRGGINGGGKRSRGGPALSGLVSPGPLSSRRISQLGFGPSPPRSSAVTVRNRAEAMLVSPSEQAAGGLDMLAAAASGPVAATEGSDFLPGVVTPGPTDFVRGERILYRHFGTPPRGGEIIEVHDNDPSEIYYTIMLGDGSAIQTDGARLARLSHPVAPL